MKPIIATSLPQDIVCYSVTNPYDGLADHVYVMSKGRIVYESSPWELWEVSY